MKQNHSVNCEGLRTEDSMNTRDRHSIHVPDGYIGQIQLSETGRAVWWTGRVAIGLRYRPPHANNSMGQSAMWLQRMLLKRGQMRG